MAELAGAALTEKMEGNDLPDVRLVTRLGASGLRGLEFGLTRLGRGDLEPASAERATGI